MPDGRRVPLVDLLGPPRRSCRLHARSLARLAPPKFLDVREMLSVQTIRRLPEVYVIIEADRATIAGVPAASTSLFRAQLLTAARLGATPRSRS
jgi:hypothetical protein